MDNWSQTLVQAVEAVRPRLVHVQAVNTEKDTLAAGSGIVLDHYHVLASGQVASPEDDITLRTSGGKRLSGQVVDVDPVYLLAVIRLENRLPVEAFPHVPSSGLRPGQVVLAVGCPLGMDLSVTHGIISTADLTVYRADRIPVDGLLATDAALHPGSLGGPLIATDGRVAAINGISWVEGLHLSLQAEVAVRIANQIIEFGRATHPWLGFSGQPEVVEQGLIDLFNLPVDRGLVVSHVASGGPGERAGIQVFDMVVRVEEQSVDSVGHIRRWLSVHRPGAEVPLTVLRSGNLLDVSFRVEEIPRLLA